MSEELPQGIVDRALSRTTLPVTLVRFLLLGGFLSLALIGFLGGGPTPSTVVESQQARFSVHAPERLRNGNFFEMRFAVLAKAPIADATIAVPAALWREATINTMVPAAGEEEERDGEFHFHFGPLDTGQSLEFKVDGQLNPPRYGTAHVTVRLLDGDTPLAANGYQLKVLP